VQATTAASTDAYQQWFDYIDGCFAKAILGQEASSGKAEGLSKGGAQAEVRDDICQADRKDIAEIINDAIVGPLERFKYNSSDAKFQFEDDPEDLTQKATIIQTLAAAGFKPTREWVSETFNMPLAEEEERISNNEQGTRNNEVKGGEAAIKPAGGRLTANGRQTAFSQSEGLRNAISDYPGALRESATPPLANSQIRKFTNSAAPADAAKERFISAATESALRGLFDDEEAMAAFYAPLRAEVRGAFKGIALDDPALVEKFTERARGFLESLPAVYAEMDKSALEQTLQKAVFSALARGYTGQMS
jgi:phage gp29-like protein